MVDCVFCTFVFVDDSKCWTIDLFGDAELMTNGFDESGFTSPHMSVKGD